MKKNKPKDFNPLFVQLSNGSYLTFDETERKIISQFELPAIYPVVIWKVQSYK